MFDKGQKQSSTLSCDSSYFIILFFLLFFFSFSSGCDRYVENDDECCNITFLDLILPTLWKMLLIVLQFRLAVSAIGNEYLCCKQDFSIPPIT